MCISPTLFSVKALVLLEQLDFDTLVEMRVQEDEDLNATMKIFKIIILNDKTLRCVSMA